MPSLEGPINLVIGLSTRAGVNKNLRKLEKAEVTEAEDHDLYANEFFKDERKHKLVCSSVVKHNLI